MDYKHKEKDEQKFVFRNPNSRYGVHLNSSLVCRKSIIQNKLWKLKT